MKSLPIFMAIICVIGISCGQILFKQSANSIANATNWRDWIFNGWLMAALILYGITTLAWVWVLRELPLHLAYPFMALAFLIVPCLSWLFLDEPVSPATFIGGALILTGVIISTRTS